MTTTPLAPVPTPAPAGSPSPAGAPSPAWSPDPAGEAPDSATATASTSATALTPCTSPARQTYPKDVWPASTRPGPRGDMAVGGVSLAEAAERFGTPLYVLDEGEVRDRCRTYRAAFPPEEADVVYAAKAFLSRAVVRWVREEGLGLDVCSAGELLLAISAGFPADRIVLHGNAKSPEDLSTAVRLGVGRIVLDSTSEIARLAALVPHGTRQPVMIRVVPGISAGGHAAVRTGTEDQKFGLSLMDGSAQHAIDRVLGQPGLELVGLHCHIGSQITSITPYVSALRRMVGLLARTRDKHGVVLPELDMGAGTASRTGRANRHSTSPRSPRASVPNSPPGARGPCCRCPG